MMKKLFALLLVLSLCVGVLSVTAVTATAAGTTKASDDVDYRVGYSKVDINPYWSVWEATGGSIPTDLENYSVDQNGNPIGSDHIMPLPMGGYGGNVHRLSRPELIDDNGSGLHASGVVYLQNNRYTQAFAKEMLGEGTAAYNAYAAEGFGQNDGDGLYATCVAIRQNADAEPVLIFSVDMISVAETYAGQAKNVIIRELKQRGIHIDPSRILINATHSHGTVALGESFTAAATYRQKLWGNTATVPFLGSDLSSYLNTYRKHMYSQLAAAAVKALTDGQSNGTVTMKKGTIDASDATGYQLNGVRHRKAQLTTTVDGVSQTVDYVTGSSFNVDLDGEKEISGVSASNDLLHVVQFSFPDAEPILMVNWRAHTTANNKMNTKAHNNLSADFVAAMRYQLEQWGYRPILNYGASGNQGMGDVPTTYNISTSSTTTTMNGTKYGYDLAYAAAFLANSSQSEVQTYRTNKLTEIKNKRGSYSSSATSNYQIWNKVYTALSGFTSPGLTECAQGPILLESTYYNVAYQSTSDAEYQAALYHNALAVDEGGSAANDGGLKLEKTDYPFVVKAGTYTANGESYTIEEDVVIASQYHANSLKNRHGTLNAKRISLCAFMLGEQVAFVTVPFEASDRYSMEATLDTASNYNDWDNLVNTGKWGTPIVMSLTNGAEGYIPNNLAYTYSTDLQAKTLAGTIGQAFVAGSYEAHTAYAKAGQGEAIVAELNTLLRGLENGQETPVTKTGYCEACKTTVTWTALNDKVVEDHGTNLATGHYYLAENYETIYGQLLVYLDEVVCLDLNGKTFYSNTNTSTSRTFQLYGTLNVQDSKGGVMKGKMSGGNNGGTVLVSSMGVLNLYSGTITCDTTGTGTVQDGGCVYVSAGGTFNLYGGTVSGGKVSRYGGNIHAQDGTFNMYGGTVTGGSAASANYANLMISAHSTFRFVGGSIPSGAYVQGALHLGSSTVYPANTNTATLIVRNNSTVTLDGIFTGRVKLNYSDSAVYPTSPANGDTIGTVVPGSWIDHVNGAKISVTSVSNYEGVVDGTNLKVGTKPATGHCDVCGTDVIWMPMVSGATHGHFALSGALDGMQEQTIPAGSKLCLNLNGKTYTAAARAFTVNGTLNVMDTKSGGVLQGTVVNGADGGTIYVSANGVVNQHGGQLTCVQSDSAKIANGGVVYVAADGSYVLQSGTVTGGTATTGGNVYLANGTLSLGENATISSGSAVNGGNLYVAAKASFTMDAGTITAGTATGNGGNVHVAGSFIMNNGKLTNGVAQDTTGTHMGGNVYTNANFTLNGGSISGGSATYGGNIQAQGGKAVFVMTGGTVTGGSGASNICTGQSGSDTGLSSFRMEGGKVVGMIWGQGNVTLAGTTDGTVNITVKVPEERLTIEGTYTGKINLTLNGGTYATGDKIGISNGADISGAAITVTGHSDNYMAVVGNELQLAADTVTSISVKTNPTKTSYWLGEELDTTGLELTAHYSDGSEVVVTEGFTVTGFNPNLIGEQTLTVTYEDVTTTFTVTVNEVTYVYFVNGVGYIDWYEAMAASSNVYPVVLGRDAGTLTLNKNVYLDLNGFDVTEVTTNGYTLTVMDTATADYDSPDADSYGTVPAVAGIQAADGYLDITENGSKSFHKYEMELQYVNISAGRKGISYTTTFHGDQVIKAQIKEFGIAMRLYAAPNATTIWADPEGLTHVALDQSQWRTGGHEEAVKSVYIKNIVDWAISDEENIARAQVLIYGRSYIQLKNGTMLFSTAAGFSMQSAMEEADAQWERLGEDAQGTLQGIYEDPNYNRIMKNWYLPNIKNAVNETVLDIPA